MRAQKIYRANITWIAFMEPNSAFAAKLVVAVMLASTLGPPS